MGVQPWVLVVIPARFSSTRLPGKPLSEIHGQTMIQRVYGRAKLAHGVTDVVVATDDERVLKNVQSFGGRAVMTDPALPSGTDRIAAVAKLPEFQKYQVLVNVQGDEPFIEPSAIEAAAALVSSGKFPMATIMSPLRSTDELQNQAIVKVVADRMGRALYFSRHPIPYSRGQVPQASKGFAARRHVGLYAYSRETLLRLSELDPSECEKGEMLEQLRAMEDGISIGIQEVDFVSIGVDTPEELEKARAHAASLEGKN